jgi:hypothetical protein
MVGPRIPISRRGRDWVSTGVLLFCSKALTHLRRAIRIFDDGKGKFADGRKRAINFATIVPSLRDAEWIKNVIEPMQENLRTLRARMDQAPLSAGRRGDFVATFAGISHGNGRKVRMLQPQCHDGR